MGNSFAALTALLVLACAVPQFAQAEDDPAVARVREMLRRTQEALRQAQSENSELTRSKADAEQKLQATTKELDAARGVSKAETALRAQLQTTKSAQDDLAQKLKDTAAQLSAANTRQSETAKELAAKEAELKETARGLDQSKAATASCEDKNLKLYGYAEALLDQYKNKGVWSALAQKEPVLGFKEVGVENVVQEYKLKFENQKAKP